GFRSNPRAFHPPPAASYAPKASHHPLDGLPPGLDPRLRARAERGAAWVREQAAAGRKVTIVHHIDADGVTSGAIAAETLTRAGVPHELLPVKSLDDFHIAKIREVSPTALWFCDLGSTAYMHF